LITKNTVEESIVHRAQKKLFLDSMVNRGSTSNALAMDKLLQSSKDKAAAAAAMAAEEENNRSTERSNSLRRKRSRDSFEEEQEQEPDENNNSLEVENENDNPLLTDPVSLNDDETINPFASKKEGEIEEEDAGKIYSLLKFGWNSVFAVNQENGGGREAMLSDEDLDHIIDRNRGTAEEEEKPKDQERKLADDDEKKEEEMDVEERDKREGNGSNRKILENQQTSIATFDESAPLVCIDSLRQQTLASLEKEIAENHIREKQVGKEPSLNQHRVSPKRMISDSASILNSKRTRKSRMEEVFVEGVGFVNTLRENTEAPRDGDLSLASKNDILAGFIKKRQVGTKTDDQEGNQMTVFIPAGHARQVAGRDYHHQEFCQVCWDGGELLLCEGKILLAGCFVA
jgi:hypothetical protein